MAVSRTYDLTGYPPDLVRHLQESLSFGEVSVLSASLADAALSLELADEDAATQIDAMVASFSRARKRLREKVLYERSAERLHDGDIDQALEASGSVYRMAPGLCGLSGSVLDLYRYFERTFLELSRKYGAEEQLYPVMLPVQMLEETGYFTHFPQQITFCSYLPEDLHLLSAIVEHAVDNDGTVLREHLERTGTPAFALKPAVCLPCYGQFRNTRFAPDELMAVTMQNHVFRYEGANFTSLARLWDFSVRDIVFFGSYPKVSEARKQVMEDVFQLCEDLDLEASIRLANDPFFLGETIDMSVYQRIGEVKYELLLSLPQSDSEIAASSFNLHRDFFTRVYDIRLSDDKGAETACMGFGLERWVYAFLSQKGLDPRGWPELARRGP